LVNAFPDAKKIEKEGRHHLGWLRGAGLLKLK